MSTRILAFILLALPLGLSRPAPAQTLDLADIISAQIRPGWTTAQGTRIAALHLTLAPHWKTYWRAPGDSGIPPYFDLSGSTNIASMTIHWPRPEVFDLNGLQTIGYSSELVLPLEFAPVTAGQAMALVAEVNLGVCENVCVPVMLNLAADLVAGAAQDPLIVAALADQPAPARTAGLTGVRCTVEPIEDGLRLSATLTLPAVGALEVGVVELADASIWVSAAETTRNGNDITLVSDLVPPAGAPFALDRSMVRLTILGGDRAVDLSGCPAG